MIKNIIATSLVAATLVFSGCGSDEGETALSVQQKLDQHDFIGAISILEGNTNTDGEKMQLGSAYMGAAGLSTTDLVRIMSETTDDETSSSSSAPSRVAPASTDSTSFAKFAEVLQRLAEKNPKMLEYLNKATKIFEKVSSREDSQSLGFAIGLANTAKATTTLTYLGDINAIVDGGITGDLTASACVISYMYAGPANKSSKCTSYTEIPKGANDTPYDMLKVTLIEDDDSTGTYLRLVGGVPGQHTGAADDGEMYIHKDYIDAVTGEITAEANDGVNEPVAVLIDGEPITIKDTLVDALNQGFDTIIDYAPEDSKDDILEYRDEIDLNKNGLVESSEIAKYLEAELAKR